MSGWLATATAAVIAGAFVIGVSRRRRASEGLCDAYGAMTAGRPYRAALPEAAARAQLESGAGSQFDGRVVEALLKVLDASKVAAS